MKNPHKRYIMDEDSGIEVINQRYIDWQEGYSAGRMERIVVGDLTNEELEQLRKYYEFLSD
jgi:hypothetical protein